MPRVTSLEGRVVDVSAMPSMLLAGAAVVVVRRKRFLPSQEGCVRPGTTPPGVASNRYWGRMRERA
jgi:hypothetical protein